MATAILIALCLAVTAGDVPAEVADQVSNDIPADQSEYELNEPDASIEAPPVLLEAPTFDQTLAVAIGHLQRDELDEAQGLADAASAMQPPRWEPQAISASISARRGAYGEAVLLLRQAIERADEADRPRLEALVSRWDRQRTATLMLAEAAAAVRSDQPYLAADRLAVVIALLATPGEVRPTPAEAPSGEALDAEALYAVLGRSHGPDLTLQARSVLDAIAGRAERDPVIADELQGRLSPDAWVRRAVHDLWSCASMLHQLGMDRETLAALDQLLQLSPRHAGARELAASLWKPRDALGEDLHRLYDLARRNALADDAGLAFAALGAGPVRVAHDGPGVGAATMTVPLGRWNDEERAMSAFVGFVERCDAALPPGWRREEAGPRGCRLRPPARDAVLELQLVLVTYDQPDAAIHADAILTARHTP